MPQISLKTIASTSGYSISTVSRALRNHSRLPPETCQHIQSVARSLGYVPNARLRELMTYLKHSNQHWDKPVIAVVGDIRSTNLEVEFWKGKRNYLAGAARQAHLHGYQLEAFPLNHGQISHKRLSRILYHRGISGIFVGAMENPSVRLNLEWEHFTSVALGHSLSWPMLHRVSNHQFHSMRTCYQNTSRLGYRRIGFVLLELINARTDQNLHASYLLEQASEPEACRIPILILQEDQETDFQLWYDAHRPDVIIYAGNDIPMARWLKNLSLRTPDDIGLVNAGLNDDSPNEVTGMLHNLDLVGAAAIDLLIAEMQKNQRGIPDNPKYLLLEGTWHEGRTTKRVQSDKETAHSAGKRASPL